MEREEIQAAVSGALERLGMSDVDVFLEHPGELSHGDYSTNVALAAAKKAGKNPKIFAEELVQALGAIDGVQKIDVAGPGFINFHLSRDFFTESVAAIAKAGDSFGRTEHLKGQRIMYEFTDPNPFKVFHIGHLMSNAIGESLSRIADFHGAAVVRANYQGDIGPHVAKCLWGIQRGGLNVGEIADLGKAYVIGSTAYEDDPKAKEEIDVLNKKLYARTDDDLNQLYETGRRVSLMHFEILYKLLGTKFDHYFFESEVGPLGVEIVKTGLARGIFEESEGAIVYKGEKKGLHTRVFITKAGTPTYEAKELGLNKEKCRLEKLDHSIIITANEQSSYFDVVLAAMADVLPDVAAITEHVSHGFMELVGGKMSSRKGNVVTGESLIEDVRTEALVKMEDRDLGDAKQEIADAVAIAAIKYSILKQGAGKNIVFNPEQSLSFEGDSGPYLQYSYVRALSVLKKASSFKLQASSLEPPKEVSELERLLYRFPEVIERAQNEYEPHYITTFLTELAAAFNGWYAKEQIVDVHDATSPYKVALAGAFATTMKNGLWLLGIQAPEKM
jgi:arginyl-tRNA synthetase